METKKITVTLVFLLTLVSSSYAQSNTAIIRGIVTDKAGAVVTGAKVRLTKAITSYEQQTETDGQGTYRLIDVPYND